MGILPSQLHLNQDYPGGVAQQLTDYLALINSAATFYSNNIRITTGSSWLPDATAGANWLPRDASFPIMASHGNIAIAGMSRSIDGDQIPSPPATIGVAGYSIADSTLTSSAWGGYFECQYERGYAGYGIEVVVKNKKDNVVSTPDFAAAGTIGIWLDTGDDSYGGVHTNPNNSAIQIGHGPNNNTWNRGIVIYKDALTTDAFGRGRAISLGKLHHISWYDGNNNEGFYITSGVATSGKGWSFLVLDDIIIFQDQAGASVFSVTNLHGSAKVNVKLPVSNVGLVSGDLWNNGGVVNIVP